MVTGRAPAMLAALLAALLALPAAAAPPGRVVSINLCTDQLAMALAVPGQLVSVSALAADPEVSLMADAAAAIPANHGRAEEIYLLRPDLVLASTFTTPATLSMLRRLGVPVMTFAPETSLEGIRASILQMGEALGRQDAAEQMAQDFDANLAALRQPHGPDAPLAATWRANGYLTGTETLESDVLRVAGFALLAERLGMEYGAMIPLEMLLMADPDAIISDPPESAPARAEDVVRHPALARSGATRIEVRGREWVCGLPQVLDTIVDLDAARQALPR